MRNMLKSSLLAFFLIPLIASSNDNLPAGDFDLNIGARPSSPYPVMRNYNTNLTEQGSGPAYPTAVSRHHIIPFNILRSFYNRLAENNQLPNVSGFLTSYSDNLRFYASSNGIACGSLGNDLLDAGNLGLAQRYFLARHGGQILAPGFDTFEQFYAWLPGNLFIGPNMRSDDPEEGFENNVNVVVGTERFNIFFRAHRNMLQYINGDNSPTLLNSISVDLTRIASRKSVFPLNPQDWVYTRGEYHLKKDEANSRSRRSEMGNTDQNKYICVDDSPPDLVNRIITIL